MKPTPEQIKQMAIEEGARNSIVLDPIATLQLGKYLAFDPEQLQVFANRMIEIGRKDAYTASINATHECIYCYLRYTPSKGESEDCPNCGCDGTSEWVENAIRNNTGE